MRFSTITTLLLPAVVLAAPPSLSPRDDSECAPTSYTLSDFTLVTAPTSAYLNFNFKSAFPNPSIITDAVTNGANCVAYGPSIPNSNECRVPDRKLLFDLRAPQEQAYYQITHTWTCNGSTWMSGNAIKVEPLTCSMNGDARLCSGGAPKTFTPQNVRKICSTPTCP